LRRVYKKKRISLRIMEGRPALPTIRKSSRRKSSTLRRGRTFSRKHGEKEGLRKRLKRTLEGRKKKTLPRGTPSRMKDSERGEGSFQ